MIIEGRTVRFTFNLRRRVEILLLIMMSYTPLQPAGAQEIPRPSLIREAELAQDLLPGEDYNFRLGQVRFSMNAGVTTAYNSNVFLTKNHREGDFIVTPQLGVSTLWPASDRNTISLTVTLGYRDYLQYHELNSAYVTVAPGSALKFDIYVGDFKIDLHDYFTLTDYPVGETALSGVGRLPIFTNSAGVTLLWDADEVISSIGYDHYNFMTLGSATTISGQSSNLSALDHTTDQLSTSFRHIFNASASGGLEGTLAEATFPEDSAADYTSVSAGPYADVQLTRLTHLYASGGFKGYWSKNGEPAATGAAAHGSGFDPGYYWSAIIEHRLNHYYSDSLAIGHDDEATAYSGRLVSTYVRYSSNWRINSRFSLTLGPFVEDVTASSGNFLLGLPPTKFTLVGGNISTAFNISRHANVSLSYTFAKRIASDSTQNYTQNIVSLSLQYHF